MRLAGWKSIRDQRIDFASLNVLIGANGAGKSNLVSFLAVLSGAWSGRLYRDVAAAGGADSILHFGSKTTAVISTELSFEDHDRHRFELIPVPGNQLVFAGQPNEKSLELASLIVSSVRVFHLLDTSFRGPLRLGCEINANRGLHSDGSNLPAMLYLYRERHPTAYHRIVAAVRSVAPYFDDFVLEPLRLDPTRIELRWRAVGREYDFGPHQLSDGTLRAIALFTLLLAPPEDRPGFIVLDEPELGLHPAAITIFADLVREAARHSQVLIATQSPNLVDQFEPQDVIVVNSRNGESSFERLNPDRLKDWLDDYSVGELWERNVIGGGPY